jgi:hypothetical protein
MRWHCISLLIHLAPILAGRHGLVKRKNADYKFVMLKICLALRPAFPYIQFMGSGWAAHHEKEKTL